MPRAQAWLAAQQLLGHPLVLVQPGHKKTYKRGRIGTAGQRQALAGQPLGRR